MIELVKFNKLRNPLKEKERKYDVTLTFDK